MGKVWAARALGPRPMQRLVAIKTALSEAMANPEFDRLFMDEARIASLIQHPNVCGIQGLDEENGITYLVMDWSDGGTLRELLDGLPGQKADPFVAARIVADVCAGLQAAHELEGEDSQPLNVVHRDVSPQNILIASTGHVRIADFGVAKARGQLHRPTETGEMKGKLSYMAPEQVTTRDLDRRVDIFALGCVLYEATLGSRPFHGEDALSTLYQLLEQPLVPPSQVADSYPAGLEAIVVKALAKNPDERFQTAEEMQQALHTWLATEKRVVTERGVAEILSRALGHKMAERLASIRDTISRLDSNSPVAEPARLQSDRVTEEPSIRSVNVTANDQSPRRFPLRRTAAAAAAAATITISWAAWNGSPPVSSVEELRQAAAAVAQPMATGDAPPTVPSRATIEQVRVMLKAEPSNAILHIDGGPPLANPYVTVLPADTVPHVIEVSAPGFEPRSETVRFDRTQDIVIALKRAVAVPKTEPSSETRNLRQKPPAPPDTSPTAAKKPPRLLDQENPF